jgi:hypothetical protein
MAKGLNARKWGNSGKEWFGKRPFSWTSVSKNRGMKSWKRLLHKAERNQGKNQIREEL